MDYKKIGLKCGLEIHQQLDGKKLFCDCPTHITEDNEPHTAVKRKLRAVIGETGEIDSAAAKEQSRSKYYEYRIYKNTTCLVDIDEEPPHVMNQEALYTTLQLTKLLSATSVDEVQIMRKTVVDGSNTSGFQRTALIARNGKLTSSLGKVGIQTICLEEDSAKIVARTATHDIYNLSRLGIPLIEIATDPDITTPVQAQEVAAHLGMLLRSTGRVKRGLGTIRQDVNVSIKGGNRVEIKGAQDLTLLSTLVDHEIIRQQTIITLKQQFKQITKQKNTLHDVSSLFSNTANKRIQQHKTVFGFKLNNAHGIIGTELQPNKRVGTDLSDYAKVTSGIGGLIHSDEELEKKYLFTQPEIQKLNKILDIKNTDGFILFISSAETAQKAHGAIYERLTLLSEGVPKEVRKANDDATTSYLRPMPGAARMYPETDTIPVDIKHIDVHIPELIDQKIERYQTEFSLSKDLAELIAKGQNWPTFEHLVKQYPALKPATIAETIESTPAQLKRKFNIEKEISIEEWNVIFDAISIGDFVLSTILELFVKAHEQTAHIRHVISQFKPMSSEDIHKKIKDIIAQHPNAPFGLLMGKAMQALEGKADGKIVSELLKKLTK